MQTRVPAGTNGASAARLAIARAQQQLALEANVHLHVRNFQVGAASLRATLNCDAFATAHSAESHFDRSSFVGLAWRPPREHICCEIYSTGRANLPGSVAERQLLASFSRMLPELLRFSSANHLLKLIPEEQQKHHHISTAQEQPALVEPARRTTLGRARQHLVSNVPVRKKVVDLWDGWGDAAEAEENDGDEGSDLDLDGLGL